MFDILGNDLGISLLRDDDEGDDDDDEEEEDEEEDELTNKNGQERSMKIGTITSAQLMDTHFGVVPIFSNHI